jgi:hypothetical protein
VTAGLNILSSLLFNEECIFIFIYLLLNSIVHLEL